MNLELFPCSGGVALGFRRAGIEFDLAIDADPDACASYEANLGHRPVQMDARDFLRLVRDGGWRPKTRIELFVADPPCTPYSRAGKRLGPADERDMLGVTVELIDLLRPVAWVIANVPGLDDADQWEAVVKPVIGGMAQRAGYCVDYASMDAADHGVPQRRIRPFWFGHPVGTPCIRWPAPTHADPATLVTLPLPGIAPLEPWVTTLRPHAMAPHGKTALAHLDERELGRKVRLRWKTGTDHRPGEPGEPGEPAKTLTTNPNSDGAIIAWGSEDHKPRGLCEADAPAATIVAGGTSLGGGPATTVLVADRCDGGAQSQRPINADGPGAAIQARSNRNGPLIDRSRSRQGGGALWSRQVKPALAPDEPARTQTKRRDSPAGGSGVLGDLADRPSTTVTRDERLPPPGHHAGSSYMSEGWVLSERARGIIQGFPDGPASLTCERCGQPLSGLNDHPVRWHFCAKTATSRSSMLGQAMPPPFAEAVARQIAEWMKERR